MKLPQPIDKLRILLYPHPALRRSCRPVESFDGQLKALADQMIALMREQRGVGLAGPQVGVLNRLFVCNPTGEPQDDHIWVNPVLVEMEGSAEAEEGCLSIPGVSVLKRRATRVIIEARDVDGKAVRTEGTDLVARVWQHEIEHLDGRLVIDDMSEATELTNRRIIKQLEADYGDSGKLS